MKKRINYFWTFMFFASIINVIIYTILIIMNLTGFNSNNNGILAYLIIAVIFGFCLFLGYKHSGLFHTKNIYESKKVISIHNTIHSATNVNLDSQELLVSKLNEIERLREENFISQEEYEAKRKQIIEKY
jgi:hypothetical protein